MTWLSQRARGGGILGALGSHHTDCLRLFFGEPRAVQASLGVLQPRRGPTPERPEAGTATADDACTLSYEFADGATGLVDLNATTPYRFERFEIQGSEAALRWDENGYRLWRIVHGREPEEIAIPVIVSGGLASLDDIARLLEPRAAKLAGAIAGRALYDGRLNAGEALRLIRAARTAGAGAGAAGTA